jgi:inhibitor of KinA sporulation pathway (predicted exonuclease)
MARALKIAGLPLEGTHHRAIDDVRNIAKLAMLVLPKLATMRTGFAIAHRRFRNSSMC